MQITKQVKIVAKDDNQPVNVNRNGSIYLGSVTLIPDELQEYLTQLPLAIAEAQRIHREQMK